MEMYVARQKGHRQQIELLVADVDPPAQVRVPLPASSGAGGAAQAGNSYPYAAATTAPTAASAAMTRAAATVTNAATDMCNAAAATDVSATDVNSAATATRMDPAARLNAAAATSMGTAAAATAVTAAAATAVTRGNSYAAVTQQRVVFFVEDMKSRQANVRDFLLAQKNSPWVVLRPISWRCGC